MYNPHITNSQIELIGVPFDGYGRLGNQARAASALRAAGLESAFGTRKIVTGPDLDLPEPMSQRSAISGLMNEAALVAMTEILQSRVRSALSEGRFPFVYGGDCSTLLGAFSGLHNTDDKAGLVYVDGHEDTTPLDVSEDGEAANAVVGFLLGIIGKQAPNRLRKLLPVLQTEALVMLGQSDQEYRRKLNVPSLANHNVWLRNHNKVASNPAAMAQEAVEYLMKAASGWWLHSDLDVLSHADLISQRVPGSVDEEGGLSWSQLTEVVSAAFRSGGCRGWSMTIYDPEQDPDGSEARRIVQFVTDVAHYLP